MLIGISGKIGSGKDTVGKIIQYLVDKSLAEEDINLPDRDYWKNISFEEYLTYKTKFNDWKIVKFADTLKNIVCLLIGCTREQLEDQEFKNTELGEEWWYYKIPKFPGQADLINYNQPDLPAHWLEIANPRYLVKTTPRIMLQLLGTEAGRKIIHPNIWVNALFSKYKSNLCDDGIFATMKLENGSTISYIPNPILEPNSYPNWIITDMRFPNEMEAIKQRGGITIRVERDSVYRTGKVIEGKEHESETALDNAEFDYIIDNNCGINTLVHLVKEILIKENIIQNE